MLNISYAGCLVYLKSFRRSLLLKCVLQPEIAKKIIKNRYFGDSRSFKVVDLNVSQKRRTKGLPIFEIRRLVGSKSAIFYTLII